MKKSTRRAAVCVTKARGVMTKAAMEGLDRRVLLTSGTVDPLFNGGAPILVQQAGQFLEAKKVEALPGGGAVVLYNGVDVTNGMSKSFLYKYDNLGQLDGTFGAGDGSPGVVDLGATQIGFSEVEDFVIGVSGASLYLTYPINGNTVQVAVVDVNSGTVNNSASVAVFSNQPDISKITQLSDGRFAVVGAVDGTSGTSGKDAFVAVFDSSLLPDSLFGSPNVGFVTFDFPADTGSANNGNDKAESIVIVDNGFFLVGGSRGEGGPSDFSNQTAALVRLDPSGQLDIFFNGVGVLAVGQTGTETSVGEIVRVDANNVLALGQGTSTNQPIFRRLDNFGTLDANFSPSFPSIDPVDVRLTSDNKLLFLGTLSTTGLGAPTVVRYNLDGTIDGTFAANELTPNVARFDFFGNQFPFSESLAVNAAGDFFIAGTLFDDFSSSQSGGFIQKGRGINAPLIGTNLRIFGVDASPSSGFPGDTITITPKIANNGNSGSVGFDVEFFLSDDRVLNRGTDVRITLSNVGGLGASTNLPGAVTFNGTLPQGLAEGNYYLIGAVDGGNQNTEATEIDNVVVSDFPAVFVQAPLVGSGTIDPAFNNGSPAIIAIPVNPSEPVEPRFLRTLPDGRIVALSVRQSQSLPTVEIIRLQSNGSPDPTFNNGTVLSFPLSISHSSALVDGFDVLPNGEMFLAYNVFNGSTLSIEVARVDNGGSGIVSTVQFPVQVPVLNISGIKADANGLLVFGTMLDPMLNTDSTGFAAVLTPGFVPAVGFGNNGVAVLSTPDITPNSSDSDVIEDAIVTQDGGVLLAGGRVISAGGLFSPFLAKLSATGAADPGFGTSGVLILNGTPGVGGESVGRVFLTAGGQYIAVASAGKDRGFGNIASTGSITLNFYLASASGSIISAQNASTGFNEIVNVQLLGDGKVLVLGRDSTRSSTLGLLRLTSAGTQDGTFGNDTGVPGLLFFPINGQPGIGADVQEDVNGNYAVLGNTQSFSSGGGTGGGTVFVFRALANQPATAPNLTPVNATAQPSTANVGDTVTFTADIANTTSVSAGPFDVEFFLSTDSQFDVNDIQLGTRSFTGLAGLSNTGGNQPLVVQLPVNAVAGNYFLVVVVDGFGTVAESIETDNVFVTSQPALTIGSAQQLTNLAAQGVIVGPPSAAAGTNVVFTVDIRNTSTVTSGAFAAEVLLSTDAQFSVTDILVGTLNFPSLMGLSNAGGNQPLNVQLPGNLAPGNYFIVLVVDGASVVAESNETDNVFVTSQAALTVTPGGGAATNADLTVFDLDVTARSLAPGGGGRANVVLVNIGSTFAPQSVLQLVISTNTIAGDSDDILLGSTIVAPVPTDERGVVSIGFNYTVPGGAPAAVYNLIAIADGTALLTEADETNNVLVLSGAFTVAPSGSLPDLRIEQLDVSPQTVSPRGTIFVAGGINNGGLVTARPSAFRVLLSTTADLSGTTFVLDGDQTDFIEPGSPEFGDAELRVPSGVAAGQYFVLLVADFNNQVTEGNELNNLLATAGPVITVTDPRVGNTDNSIGGLNQDFGDGGVATSTIDGPLFRLVDSVVQSDGKLLAVGFSVSLGNVVAVRFNTDGSLDNSFGGSGSITVPFDDFAEVTSVALTPGGQILIGGSILSVSDGRSNLLVVRLNADGNLDTTLDGDGAIVFDLAALRGVDQSEDFLGSLAVNASGEVFIGATSIGSDGVPLFAVLKLTPALVVDGGFGGSGLATATFEGGGGFLRSVAVSSRDGSIVAAGTFVSTGGRESAAAIRFSAAGQVDTRFATGGRYVQPNIGAGEGFTSVAIDSSDRIVLGGFALFGPADAPSAANAVVVRLDSRGRADRRFDGDGVNTIAIPGFAFATVNNLVALNDGRVVFSAQIAGDLEEGVLNPGAAVVRLNTAGALDTAFDDDGILIVFTPEDGVSTAADGDDLVKDFNAFIAAAQGIVDIDTGGGIFAIATSAAESGGTTVQVAKVVGDGVDLIGTSSARLKSTSILGGTRGQITVSVTNAGNLTASGASAVTLFFSTDSLLTTTDASISAVPISVNLKPGQTKRFNVRFVFPLDLPAGVYNVLAQVNSNNGIGEINDLNNAASGLPALDIRPAFTDLEIVSGVIPANLALTGKNSLSFTIRNNGNVSAAGSAVLRLLQSSDNLLGGDDVVLGDVNLKVSLKAGASRTFKINTTPTGGTAGSLFLGASLTSSLTPADNNAANDTFFSSTAITFS